MKAPCGLEDCDCGHTIEKLVKALEEIRDCPWTSFAFVTEIRGIASAAIKAKP